MFRRLFKDVKGEDVYTMRIHRDVVVGGWDDSDYAWGFTGDISKLSDDELIELFDEYKSEHTDRYSYIIYKNDEPYACAVGYGNDPTSNDFIYTTYDKPNLSCYLSDEGSSSYWAIFIYHNHVVKLEDQYRIDIKDFEDRIYDSLA